MPKTDVEKQLAENIKLILKELGIYTEADDALAEMAAFYHSEWLVITEELRKEKRVVEGQRKGTKVKNPKYMQQKYFYDSYIVALQKLGIPPSDRIKLKLKKEKPKKDDPTNPLNI